VDIDSAEGYGMSVKVRLPLTLAIMDGMSIGVGDEVYILPLSSVVESFQVEETMIKTIGGSGRVVEVRNEYLPLMQLDQLFDIPRTVENAGGIMIVVEAEGARAALLVGPRGSGRLHAARAAGAAVASERAEARAERAEERAAKEVSKAVAVKFLDMINSEDMAAKLRAVRDGAVADGGGIEAQVAAIQNHLWGDLFEKAA
jgi:hypothetical protein